ncbi:hypothetical protein [Scopulibacillus darangshiensis]|nr:hypothetical protein [Scopulibacillus darangshiensis]
MLNLSEEEKTLMRSPEVVMNPKQLGSFRQTRISFSRSLLRKMMREQWVIKNSAKQLDDNGYGHFIYEIDTKQGLLTFIAFSDEIDEAERNDRVISEKWDITFALIEGRMTHQKYNHLKSELPKQEFGRGTEQDIVWSRANKSTRMFNYIVNALSAGEQPDPKELAKVGYILRTTAFYGNGKFGVASYKKLNKTHPLYGAFRAQMLAAYLLRHFSFELVEHIAAAASGHAVSLEPEIKRYLGIGNATGLGMVPFLIKHPKLVNRWLLLRELALARAKNNWMTEGDVNQLQHFLNAAIDYLKEYPAIDTALFAEPLGVAGELAFIKQELSRMYEHHKGGIKWHMFTSLVEPRIDSESQEFLNTLLIELFPEQVDCLGEETTVDESYELEPGMTVQRLMTIIQSQYSWVFQFDFTKKEEKYYFWYRSAEKEEPRIGIRGSDPGEAYEMEMNIAEDIQNLYDTLIHYPDTQNYVSLFLLKYPRFRNTVRRIQSLEGLEFAEIRGNLQNKGMLPIQLMRCKLSLFGADRFDPKSNKWVRITLYQGAPLISDLTETCDDHWAFPLIPQIKKGEANGV